MIVYAEHMLIYSFNSSKRIGSGYIKGKGKEIGVGLLKLFESILKAATAFVAAAISVVKIIDSMGTKKA